MILKTTEMLVWNILKILVQWILRLSLITGLSVACCIFLIAFIFDPSSQYYKQFPTIISDMSMRHISAKEEPIFRNKIQHCIDTAKVITYWEAMQKCTGYRNRYLFH